MPPRGPVQQHVMANTVATEHGDQLTPAAVAALGCLHIINDRAGAELMHLQTVAPQHLMFQFTH